MPSTFRINKKKTVIVLGGSYGGARAAQVLAESLPDECLIIMIDRNSHANHLYVLPRLGVFPGHEHKAFIPYTNVFHPTRPSSPPSSIDNLHANSSSPGPTTIFLQAHITDISPTHVTLDRSFPPHGFTNEIAYDYAVYALGSHLPSPIDLWAPETQPSAETPTASSFPKTVSHLDGQEFGHARCRRSVIEEVAPYNGTKPEGVAWLKRCQDRIAHARSVLVVGGGALGIQFATDIAAVHPTKPVTLLHSRDRLLPRFDLPMHTTIMQALEDLRVDVILGSRLDLATTRPGAEVYDKIGRRVVRTEDGREIAADLLLLCTGQIPNTALLSSLYPEVVDEQSKLVRVLRTMQIAAPIPIPTPSSPAPSLLSGFPSSPCMSEMSTFTSSSHTPSDGMSIYDDKEENGRLEMGDLVLALDNGEDDEEYGEEGSSGRLTSENDDGEGEDDEEVLRDSHLFTPYPHIFAIGDASDAFGAINAGHNAYYQGEVAARNIVRLIKRDIISHNNTTNEIDEELELYTPNPPAIKVSLGLQTKSVYEINGVIGTKDDGNEDLDAGLMWRYFGVGGLTEEEMLV
ncbi:FAD/NAD(P)-binding domain-containing protein [Rickenella mellea]|uniref:FAD/NAD(P)-binding domain-containing protein n=1 Tax=Rickenella mellea TaxID=50990 RepID=A0A4Y7QAD6_9AGAM|nr:FAD/NAD(P)-binding domain-containing protein [Rickenella mellea]